MSKQNNNVKTLHQYETLSDLLHALSPYISVHA